MIDQADKEFVITSLIVFWKFIEKIEKSDGNSF